MLPSTASMIRKTANANELLPAPVLPTIPIFSAEFMENVIFQNQIKVFSIPGRVLVELNDTLLWPVFRRFDQS